MPIRAPRPAMFAVVGDAGAGKRTLIRGVLELLGADRVTRFCLDDYLALDRETRRRAGVSALHPDGLHLGLMGQHLRLLRQGETVFKPVYDHATGQFASPEFVRPGSIVLAHGLHALYTPELRALWDVSVFLDPDPVLRERWKLRRDRAIRGYSSEQAIAQLEAIRADSAAFIAPQRERADLVLSFRAPAEPSAPESALDVQLRFVHPIPLPALDALDVGPAALKYIRLERAAGGADHIEISGQVDDFTAAALEDSLLARLPITHQRRELGLGLFHDGASERRSHALALAQLILAHYLAERSARVLPELLGADVSDHRRAAPYA